MIEWKEICSKCSEGEIEPKFCEYYGEPNGCNSPICGEHPTVGNMAAIREFAEYVANYQTCKGCNGQTDSRFCESCPKGVALAPLALRARLALSEAKGDADVLKTQVGNAAAMREALEKIDRIVWDKPRHTKEETEAHRLATEALSEPKLNCDVGTASERYRRFLVYCKKNTGGCDRADRHSNPCAYCFSQWEQMPYEEGGAK